MVNEKMQALGAKRSVIRELFEYGKLRKAEIGEENVFDFSLGNPSTPAPDAVKETLVRLLAETYPGRLHG
jgi:aspartate aminotransferase